MCVVFSLNEKSPLNRSLVSLVSLAFCKHLRVVVVPFRVTRLPQRGGRGCSGDTASFRGNASRPMVISLAEVSYRPCLQIEHRVSRVYVDRTVVRNDRRIAPQPISLGTKPGVRWRNENTTKGLVWSTNVARHSMPSVVHVYLSTREDISKISTHLREATRRVLRGKP